MSALPLDRLLHAVFRGLCLGRSARDGPVTGIIRERIVTAISRAIYRRGEVSAPVGV